MIDPDSLGEVIGGGVMEWTARGLFRQMQLCSETEDVVMKVADLELLRVTIKGDIFVERQIVGNSVEVYEALKNFLLF